MAIFKLKCADCDAKFELEVTKDKKPKSICPKCQSENIRADYEQSKTKQKFEPDGIRCFCALK